MPFSDIDLEGAVRFFRARHEGDPFAYVVTPNTDHVVRAARGGETALALYRGAILRLCDSRILTLLAALVGLRLRAAPGSDLARLMFETGVIDPCEPITVIGMSDAEAARLVRRYGLTNMRHHNPPNNLRRNRPALLAAADFIERSCTRFTFVVVGSPQQEELAALVKSRARATGLALCFGASLLFLSGDLRRAPQLMQKAHLEWLFRLLCEPRRLWRRYLLDGSYVFLIFAKDLLRRWSMVQRT